MFKIYTRCPKCREKYQITSDTFKCKCGSFCFNGKWTKSTKKIKDTKKMIQERIDEISKKYIIERIRNRIDRRAMTNDPKYQNLNTYSYQELEIILGGLDG